MEIRFGSVLNVFLLYVYLLKFCQGITPEDEGVKYASKCEGKLY